VKYNLVIQRAASRFLNALLDNKLKSRINDSIALLADNPRHPQCKKMAGFANLYRIRVGDYRVIYEINDGTITVLVLTIGHRSDIYR